MDKMELKNLAIDAEIIESFNMLTTIDVSFQKEIPESAAVTKLKDNGINYSLNSLLDIEHLDSNLEIKDALIVYFYLNNVKGKSKNDSESISQRLLQERLGVKQSYLYQILKEYEYKHPISCPCCNTVNIVNFSNLKEPEIYGFTECSSCGHLIGRFIKSICKCRNCVNLISSFNKYINNLSSNFDNIITPIIEALRNELKTTEYSQDRMKWYADKYSSDLSKTEREVISFKPCSIDELRDI